MSNQKYDLKETLTVVVDYFQRSNIEEIASLPFERVYGDILESKEAAGVQMPAFSQMRKFIISTLRDLELFKDGDRLTTRVAYGIVKCMYDPGIIEELLLNEYSVSVHDDDPIICIIQLPPLSILDSIAEGYSEENNKSLLWGRINVMRQLCRLIKKRSPDQILAVIPEFSRSSYLNENGKIDNSFKALNTLPDAICVFVRNTTEGRKLIESMKPSNDKKSRTRK